MPLMQRIDADTIRAVWRNLYPNETEYALEVTEEPDHDGYRLVLTHVPTRLWSGTSIDGRVIRTHEFRGAEQFVGLLDQTFGQLLEHLRQVVAARQVETEDRLRRIEALMYRDRARELARQGGLYAGALGQQMAANMRAAIDQDIARQADQLRARGAMMGQAMLNQAQEQAEAAANMQAQYRAGLDRAADQNAWTTIRQVRVDRPVRAGEMLTAADFVLHPDFSPVYDTRFARVLEREVVGEAA